MGIQIKKSLDPEETQNSPFYYFSFNNNDKNAVKYHLNALKQSIIYFSYHLFKFVFHSISAFYYLFSDTIRDAYDKIPAEAVLTFNNAVLYRDVLIDKVQLPDPSKTFYAEVGIKT